METSQTERRRARCLRTLQLQDLLPPDHVDVDFDDFLDFADVLMNSRHISALLGAGLSVPSGMPTFRGLSGLWTRLDPEEIASLDGFEKNPGLSWQFWADKRIRAIDAQPNAAHHALARLSAAKDFLSITQNIDGLSQRAGHTAGLVEFHGSLNEVRCTAARAHVSLLPASERRPELLKTVCGDGGSSNRIRLIADYELPHCGEDGAMLRPNVLLYGESPAEERVRQVEEWYGAGPVDLMLVVGTTAAVFPAASYIAAAKAKGAKIAIVNVAPRDGGLTRNRGQVSSVEDDVVRGADWYFGGSVEVLLPLLLAPVIGKLDG